MTENSDQQSELRFRNQSQICRVCLTTNTKMYSLQRHGYYKKYQDVTGLKISQDDNYPGYLCWECAHNLLSCHRFKTRAVLSHYLLTDLLETDKNITEQSVRKINRYKNGLVSRLKQYKNPPNYFDLILNNDQINNTIQNEPTNTTIETTVLKSEDVEDEIKQESLDVKEESSDDDRSIASFGVKVITITDTFKPNLKTPKATEAKTIKKAVKPKPKVKQNLPVKPKRKPPVEKPVKKNTSEYLDRSMFEITDLTLEEQISEIEKRKKSKNYMKSNFRCEKCYKGFLDESAFKFHSIRHTDQSGEHECPVCKIHFKTSKAMKHHLNSHIQRYSCKHCVFATTRKHHAKLHGDFHKGTKYKCPHCEEEFGQSSTYLSHIRIKHPSDIVCELCGYSFVSQKGLDLHKKLKHRFDEAVRPEDDYRCEECGITFLKKEALETHLKVTPKHANPEEKERNCGDYWSNRRKDKQSTDPPRRKRGAQQERKRGEPIQCELCDAVLASGMAYYHHFLREHPGKSRTQLNAKRTHMCEVCGNMYTNRAIMEDHKRIHGTNIEKQFKCENCGKSFLRKYALINHMSRVHSTKRRIHNCSVCGKGFNSYNLKRHMLIHTGLKPFECKMCGKFFKDVAERKLHITHVHLKVPWPKRNRGGRTRKQDTSQDSETSSTNTDLQPLWPVCDDPKNSLIAKSNYVL